MRSTILAASLFALASLASAQRLTTTDDTGQTIVVSIATDANGDPTRTRTLSTISAKETPATPAPKNTEVKGNVGAPESHAPMTATVYYYPNPADPSGEWLQASWENSFIPATSATPPPAGTIATELPGVTAKAQDAAANAGNLTGGGRARIALPGAFGLAAVGLAAGVVGIAL